MARPKGCEGCEAAERTQKNCIPNRSGGVGRLAMMLSANRREDRSRLDGFELEIFKLVREGSTFDQWREWLRVPLEHAAAKGDMDLFTRLMDAGADSSVGWRGCHGRTLLGAAACGRSEEMVLVLLEAGAKDDVNVKFGAKTESALHVAAVQGHAKVINALMLGGADPNMLDAYRQSPLHLAAEAGHDGVVNTLMLKGADPNARRELGRHAPLHLAAANGHVRCVSELVIGGADKDSRSFNGSTPLHLAAWKGRLGAVEGLLAAGASLDIRQIHHPSCSALDLAASFGHVDIVRALLRHGSSTSSSDCESGCTALHHAAQFDEPDRDNGDVVRALLEAGADIEAKLTECWSTSLHLAAFNRTAQSGTIRALLEGGANVNARDQFFGTPLHSACEQCCVGAVQALLRWGADEELANEDGKTAEEVLGIWEGDDEEKERISHMLACAPADRSWRRRGWLVLARSCPAKVQLKMEVNSDGGGGSSSNDSSGKLAKVRSGGEELSRDGMADLVRLVGRVVNLDADGVFRLVVSFL